ncbi:MAG: MBL fold metallo-hydrolase [Candidatus Delongbacteria bacterium]|nr:MBL fold metallo-hydrolase [Candidatus Delongbacteria bacterium]
MQIEFYSWGAAQEVTGSKHFVHIDEITLMIDCGAFQGKREIADKKNREWDFDPAKIDALILTHAHYDHSGLIPLLVKRGFKGNIYATPATRDLAGLILTDSAHIQKSDIEYLKKHNQNDNIVIKEPLYTDDDVQKAMSKIISIPYNLPFPIAPGVTVTFIDAGHILGSSQALIEIEKDGQKSRIGFTGDLGRKNLPILRDPDILPDPDFLFIESTYGNRLHDTVDFATDKLADIISRTAARGGKIIIPAFSIERTQELVYIIHLLTDQKKIPNIPIYVDSPMATNATSIFSAHPECFDKETRESFLKHNKNPFGFNQLHYVQDRDESKELNKLREPAIIISASGMCESGRILHHLRNNIEDHRNTILIVGFMAENTLGRKIADRQKTVRILGGEHKLNAEVKILNAFSAHADYNEILDYLSSYDPNKLKKIYMVHGEPEAQEFLKQKLIEKNFKTTIMEPGKKYIENI